MISARSRCFCFAQGSRSGNSGLDAQPSTDRSDTTFAQETTTDHGTQFAKFHHSIVAEAPHSRTHPTIQQYQQHETNSTSCRLDPLPSPNNKQQQQAIQDPRSPQYSSIQRRLVQVSRNPRLAPPIFFFFFRTCSTATSSQQQRPTPSTTSNRSSAGPRIDQVA